MYVCVYVYIYTHMHRLPGGTMVRNLLANAGDTCPIPGLGRFPGERMATHSNILTWTISWREEPGGLQSFGLQELDMTQQMSAFMRTRAHTHTHTHTHTHVPQILFSYGLLQNIEWSSLCYMVDPCWLPILYIVV